MNLLNLFKSAPNPIRRVTPVDATPRLHRGDAVLVDVREPRETADGVLEGAHVLPLSDLKAERRLWRPFLATVGKREIVLHCASGVRSGAAAEQLAGEGFAVSNGGGFADWKTAGWKVVPPA